MNLSNCNLDFINSNFRSTLKMANSFSIQTKGIALAATIFAGLLVYGKSRSYISRSVTRIASVLPPFKALVSHSILYSEIREKMKSNFKEGLDLAISNLSPEEALQLVLQSSNHPLAIPDVNEKLEKSTDRILRTFDPNTSWQNQPPLEKRAVWIHYIVSHLSLLVSDITGTFFDIPNLIQQIQSYPKNLATLLFAFSLPISFHYLWNILKPVLETVFGDLEAFEKTHQGKFALLAFFATLVTYALMRGEKAKSVVDHGEKLRFNQFPHMQLDTIPSFKLKVEEVQPSIHSEMGMPGSSIFLWHEDKASGSLRYFLSTLSEIAQTGRGNFNERMFHYWEIDLNGILAACDEVKAVRYEWGKLVNRANQAGNPYLFIPNFRSIYNQLKNQEEERDHVVSFETKERFLAQLIMDDVKEKKIRLIIAGNRKDEEEIAHFEPYSTFFSRIEVPYVKPEEMAEIMKQVYCPADRWDAVSLDDHVIQEMIKMGKRFRLSPELPEEFHEHTFDTFQGILDSRKVQPILEDPAKFDWFEVDDLMFMVEKYQISLTEKQQFYTELYEEFRSNPEKKTNILDQTGMIKQEKREEFQALHREVQQKLKETYTENLKIWNQIGEGHGGKLDAYRELKNRLLEKWWLCRQQKRSLDLPQVKEIATKLHLLEKCLIPHLQETIKEEKKKLKGFETTASYNQIFERLQSHEKNLLGPPTIRELRMLHHLPVMLNEKIMGRPEAIEEICKHIMHWRQRSTERDWKRTGPIFVFAGPPGTGKSTATDEIGTALQLTHGLVKAPLKDNLRAWPVPKFYKKGFNKIDEQMFSEIQEFIIDKKTCIVILEEFDVIEDEEAMKQILELIGDAPMKVNRNGNTFIRNEHENPTGEEVDRRNVIFIFNCNFFGLKWDGNYQADKKSALDNIKTKYKEAFLTRIWETIPFSPLSEQSLDEYIDQYILQATSSYTAYRGTVEVAPSLKEHFISKAGESKDQLRVLDRYISEIITEQLTKHIQTLSLSPKPWKATLSYENNAYKLIVT